MSQPTREQIAVRAYELWQSRGGQHGNHLEDWVTAERELSRKTVILSSPGNNKIGVIRELRTLTGITLEAAKQIIDDAPRPLRENISADEAESIRRRLAAFGATVEVR